MKELCREAGIQATKVFPHNLRHLFARTYYTLEKDLSRLADILGHSSVSTTHIYTVESGTVHARQQLARMGLITTQGQLCCWEIGVRHLYGAKFRQINSRHPREIEKQAQKTKSVEGHFSPASFSWASLGRHP